MLVFQSSGRRLESLGTSKGRSKRSKPTATGKGGDNNFQPLRHLQLSPLMDLCFPRALKGEPSATANEKPQRIT
jgi:hypothetical protein